MSSPFRSEQISSSDSWQVDQSHTTLVVDESNRIVYVHGSSNQDELRGQPPGAFFSCVHASETAEGCGTTSSCAYCGASEAIRLCRSTGETLERECTISIRDDAGVGALNYRVVAAPLSVDGSDYVLLHLADIEHEKRREALERVFYHDILNTATGLQVYLDLLKQELTGQEPLRVLATLREISESLVEEINSQRLLTSAERGTLETRFDLINLGDLAEQVAHLFADDARHRGIELNVSHEAVTGSIVSDSTILRRVLVNAAKNAIEASSRGDTVEIRCRTSDSEGRIDVRNPAYIPDEVRLQMFGRFFSTKGEHRGLGTYSMRLFTVNYLQGSISLTSDEHAGTTLTILLPTDPRKQPFPP